MQTRDGGLAATAYSPCNVHTVIRNTPVHVAEETEYPFRETVRMTVRPERAIRFPLQLRIPAWAVSPAVSVNGVNVDAAHTAGFATIERTWRAGDTIELKLPLAPRLVRGYNDSVSIARGPLVFSYPIGESWVKLRDQGMTADWQVFPSAQWNYALAVNEQSAGALRVSERPVEGAPFALKNAAVTMQASARKLPSWRAVDGVADPVPHSPAHSEAPLQQITLVPYAAAKLRITSFPVTNGDKT